MKPEVQELICQYVTETLKDINGIPKEAYELIGYMMKEDRNLASQLCEVYEQCIESGNRYFVPADDFLG